MPVVINEVEILDSPAAASRPAAAATTPRVEPAHEQLRRLLRDLDGRQQRLIAD